MNMNTPAVTSTPASAPFAPSALPLNGALKVFFKDALRVALSSPRQAAAFVRALFWLGKAARRRASWRSRGVNVPPIIIFSVTDRCNLACKGCYAQSFRPKPEGELDSAELRRVVEEARDLGVSFFVIAGGEPLLRPELEGIMADFPQIIFFVFTNGLLLNDDWIRTLRRRRNIVPLLSLEGDRAMTDERRGAGTYDLLQALIGRLKKRGIFFGVSLTLTRAHFAAITAPGYTKSLVEAGCKFFLYLEYTPTVEGTEDWTLTADQRAQMREAVPAWRTGHRALFIAVPWDEDDVGGCLSAGRGFVHINPRGDVEPCPFAPFSDSSLRQMSLKDALGSKFFEAIRAVPALARETGEGCILWKERALVTSLLESGTQPMPQSIQRT
jgi:MoaA/NifB/PqqE/SkfB family radical SAM enzyme